MGKVGRRCPASPMSVPHSCCFYRASPSNVWLGVKHPRFKLRLPLPACVTLGSSHHLSFRVLV